MKLNAAQAEETASSDRVDVPIVLGGDESSDACAASGEIVGLDPQGDGFLSVRSGPGGPQFREIDRLYNGNTVYICAREGPWVATIYNDRHDLDPNCGVSNPWRTRQPYTGPCRYGWIHSKYVRVEENADASEKVVHTPEPALPPSKAPQPEGKGGGSGTGFFVNSDGYLVTNAHVIENCTSIRITADRGTATEADVVARDVTNDLAVLRTTLKLDKVAAIRTNIRLGENVEAFGFPLTSLLATSGNFTAGSVTALAGLGDDSRYLQVSTPVQPGNSGGPLLDQNGNVVGVVSAKLNALALMFMTKGDVPQNVNFAIKADLVASFLESNRIAFAEGTASQQVSGPDLAERARAISAFIECR